LLLNLNLTEIDVPPEHEIAYRLFLEDRRHDQSLPRRAELRDFLQHKKHEGATGTMRNEGSIPEYHLTVASSKNVGAVPNQINVQDITAKPTDQAPKSGPFTPPAPGGFDKSGNIPMRSSQRRYSILSRIWKRMRRSKTKTPGEPGSRD